MDEQLRQSWQRTGTALDEAVAAIPGVHPDADLSEYEAYRQHNELGLAFDVLVALAQERQAGGDCWAALFNAAREMDLTPSDPTHGPSAAVVFARQRE